MPAAVGVVLDAGNDAGLDGVLMDVTEEGGEVVHVVDGLAAETLLEEMAAALVLAVVRGDKKRRCDGSLSNKQKNPPISRISGYSETWLRASCAEA